MLRREDIRAEASTFLTNSSSGVAMAVRPKVSTGHPKTLPEGNDASNGQDFFRSCFSHAAIGFSNNDPSGRFLEVKDSNGDLDKDGTVTHEYLLPNRLSSAHRPISSPLGLKCPGGPHEN